MTRTYSSIVLLMLGLLFSLSIQAGETKGSQCVEPTPFMRRNHFELIEHQRDETVHRGIRGSQYSLAGCIQCHAQKNDAGQFIPVNAEGQFCEQCHHRAAVHIDCFSCHRTTPEQEGR